ncbi:Uncharacterised protein [Budvicia aquatica]|uniref:Uncharacterized protein n=1 Tax=Budvicia aquatica TaxID=82979 RepID=A0A2C6DLR0_9GAMM|nr:hypothetical protein CRN84_10575 [Budvicia aquatica]VFS48198.1 Uncharacterised protein [Budvicia aquatica]
MSIIWVVVLLYIFVGVFAAKIIFINGQSRGSSNVVISFIMVMIIWPLFVFYFKNVFLFKRKYFVFYESLDRAVQGHVIMKVHHKGEIYNANYRAIGIPGNCYITGFKAI